MNIVVLGSQGFIGSSLVRSLRNSSLNWTIRDILEVTDIDLFLASNYDFDSNSVIIDCIGVKPFFYKGNNDLSNSKTQYAKLLSRYERILELAISKNVKFIFISSGGTVYGPYLGHPWLENDELNPITFYGQVCKDIEKLVMNSNGLIIRGSNIYGALKSNKQRQGLVTEVLLSYINNSKIQIFNKGHSVRDYLHIDDFVKSLINILNNFDNGFSIFNLSCGVGQTQLELMQTIDDILKDEGLPILSPIIEISSEKIDPIDINILSPELYVTTFGPIKNIQIDEGIKLMMKNLEIIK
jgi:UDP-glucose 4-epimerase